MMMTGRYIMIKNTDSVAERIFKLMFLLPGDLILFIGIFITRY